MLCKTVSVVEGFRDNLKKTIALPLEFLQMISYSETTARALQQTLSHYKLYATPVEWTSLAESTYTEHDLTISTVRSGLFYTQTENAITLINEQYIKEIKAQPISYYMKKRFMAFMYIEVLSALDYPPSFNLFIKRNPISYGRYQVFKARYLKKQFNYTMPIENNVTPITSSKPKKKIYFPESHHEYPASITASPYSRAQ